VLSSGIRPPLVKRTDEAAQNGAEPRLTFFRHGLINYREVEALMPPPILDTVTFKHVALLTLAFLAAMALCGYALYG
jgi:hypothetical protein